MIFHYLSYSVDGPTECNEGDYVQKANNHEYLKANPQCFEKCVSIIGYKVRFHLIIGCKSNKDTHRYC